MPLPVPRALVVGFPYIIYRGSFPFCDVVDGIHCCLQLTVHGIFIPLFQVSLLVDVPLPTY